MATSDLTREQIIDLLGNVLDSPEIIDKANKDDIQFCCTVHGETHPSAGISVDKQVFNCLSCHARGNIPWLLFKSKPDEFKSVIEAEAFLEARYGVDFKSLDINQLKHLRRYEDHLEPPAERKRHIVPLSFIAQFKSGKETFEYFYDRGFTKKTVIDFRIGRDLKSETVTVPIFWEDKKLAGVIGRYIDPKRRKNERYKIYEDTPTGEIAFPMDKAEPIDDTMIIVEGLLDAIWMHQLGYTNTVALLTNFLSAKQADFIRERCSKVVDMTDKDDMGVTATDSIKDKLGKTHIIYEVKHLYPNKCKDPQDLTHEQIEYMLSNKVSKLKRKLRRIE